MTEPTVVANGYEHDPSFTELVYAHYDWWRATHDKAGDGQQETAAYRDVLHRFEATQGHLVNSYWCSHLESAVALSGRPPKHRWQHHRYGFHRASDFVSRVARSRVRRTRPT